MLTATVIDSESTIVHPLLSPDRTEVERLGQQYAHGLHYQQPKTHASFVDGK